MNLNLRFIPSGICVGLCQICLTTNYVTFRITLYLNLLSSFRDKTRGLTELIQRKPKSLPENRWNVIFETEKFSNNGIPS
jgi:hypothetical protein